MAQSLAFHSMEWILIGWLFGKATPSDSRFLNSLMGVLSTENLEKIEKKRSIPTAIIFEKNEQEVAYSCITFCIPIFANTLV